MNVVDYILLAVIIAAFVAAVISIVKRRKHGCCGGGCGCTGNYSACKGCKKERKSLK